MQGLMQRTPLLLSSLITHAARNHAGREIVGRSVEGPVVRTNWGEVEARAKRLANALARLGVREGERVATLAWNTQRHLELYFGASGSGVVLHTINPRLFQAQIEYMLEHAEDQYIFFDLSFAALVSALAPRIKGVRGYIALTDRAHMPAIDLPNLLCYEELLGSESAQFSWPDLDENAASILCYTSGTTGNPKGVLYSHRALLLHSFCAAAADGAGLSCMDSVLTVVPLFHANAWGLPFAAAMCGAKLVFPGAELDGGSLFALARDEACNVVAGVPTVWFGFFDYIDRNRDKLDLGALHLDRALVGGSAAPRSLIARFDRDFGAFLLHAWGMTETSPIATIGRLLPKHAGLDREARYDIQAKQGRPVYGVEVRIVDDAGQELPRDGVAVGHLEVRGPWVTAGYFRGEGGVVVDAENWFDTGDVATIDSDGYVTLTDRAKDIIKSGGEWISSIALENAAVGHADVLEAAVIGIPHPKWVERPLLLIRCKEGKVVSRQEMRDFLADKVARWWLPDDVIIVEDLPHTATGKLSKATLRKLYANHQIAPESAPAAAP